jgi:hypothetical protein
MTVAQSTCQRLSAQIRGISAGQTGFFPKNEKAPEPFRKVEKKTAASYSFSWSFFKVLFGTIIAH